MSTIPVICRRCNGRTAVALTALSSLSCPRCKTSADLDLDDTPTPRRTARDSDVLGPCGCVDYHMADCPLRTSRGLEDGYGDYGDDYYDDYHMSSRRQSRRKVGLRWQDGHDGGLFAETAWASIDVYPVDGGWAWEVFSDRHGVVSGEASTLDAAKSGAEREVARQRPAGTDDLDADDLRALNLASRRVAAEDWYVFEVTPWGEREHSGPHSRDEAVSAASGLGDDFFAATREDPEEIRRSNISEWDDESPYLGSRRRVAPGRRRAQVDPSDPMPRLPGGVPEQDQDMGRVDPEAEVDVVVPEGSTPYTQRALAGPVNARRMARMTRRIRQANPGIPVREAVRLARRALDIQGRSSRRRTAAEEWFVYAETPGWGPTHVAGPFFTQAGAQEFIDMSPGRANWFVTKTDYRNRDFSDVGPAKGEDWSSWLIRNNID